MDGYGRMELQQFEYEARRLRAEYARDLIVRTVISFDLAVRRLACRLALAWEGSTPCRS